MRRAARVDTNQPAIVDALRQAGAIVEVTSALGNGFPDLVVGFRKRVYLLEVKDGSRPPSERELTAKEEAFQIRWDIGAGPGIYRVVTSPKDALEAITAP